MIIALASQFHIYLAWINAHQHSVLNVKALVGAFNQEKALCMIVKTDGSFAALLDYWKNIVGRDQDFHHFISGGRFELHFNLLYHSPNSQEDLLKF